jgi:phage shock protein C
MAVERKLMRSSNKILAGVCGGIAEYFDVDPTLVRICYAALSILSAAFPGLLLYIIMLLLMPEKGKNDGFEEAEVVK